MERLCHVLSNPGMLKKYSDTKTQFVSFYLDFEARKDSLWANLYSRLGVKGYSTNDEVLFEECLEELVKERKKPVLIFDNVQHILLEVDNYSEGANFIRKLILNFSAKGLAKVILVSSDQHLPSRIGSLSTIDEGSDVKSFPFSYPEGEEVTNWMKQVAEMDSRSVTDEDLQLYLKHHGSLRDFKDFCSNYKDMTLREYLKESIKEFLKSLRIQIKDSKVDKAELEEVLKPLFQDSVMEFPGEMEGLFLRLIEKNFIRRFDEDYITFNSRISESAMRVYFGEHGDSEFLKELINEQDN